MNITPTQLGSQYDRALAIWPFIPQVEQAYGLPSALLFAVGSRETNLTNEVGDGGHGWGVWQRDNRSWNVGPAYLADVHNQAVDAGSLLLSNFHRFGTWQGAAAAYNSGQPNDIQTTGHDYGADVMGRMAWLQQNRQVSNGIVAPRLLRLADPRMTGNDVGFWQAALLLRQWVPWPIPAAAYGPGMQKWDDGEFGVDTDIAVRWAQNHVGAIPDGVIGPHTIRAWQNWKGN
jgi:hypothetical protein